MKEIKKINNAAASLILNRKYIKAEELLKKTLYKYPQSPEILINLASCYQLNDKPSLSVECFFKALTITSRYPQIYSKIYHQKCTICDWSDLNKFKKLADKYSHYDSPFGNIVRVDDPKKNYQVAKNARISARI